MQLIAATGLYDTDYFTGVTFFLDQNGNNQWDTGTDIDLGRAGITFGGWAYLTVTPQPGWNLTWFAASKYHTRRGEDRFGANCLAVLRRDDAPGASLNYYVMQYTKYETRSSGDVLRFDVSGTSQFAIRASTIFLDRNQNGIWDTGIDFSLVTDLVGIQAYGFSSYTLQLDEQFGCGRVWICAAVQDLSNRGDDSWSTVRRTWLDIDNTPWITDARISPQLSNFIPFGTQLIDLNFRVHDDQGVRGFGQAFIDVNGNTEPDLDEPMPFSPVTPSSPPGLTDAAWRISFDIRGLHRGLYSIHLWLEDFQGVQGPRTVMQFRVS